MVPKRGGTRGRGARGGQDRGGGASGAAAAAAAAGPSPAPSAPAAGKRAPLPPSPASSTAADDSDEGDDSYTDAALDKLKMALHKKDEATKQLARIDSDVAKLTETRTKLLREIRLIDLLEERLGAGFSEELRTLADHATSPSSTGGGAGLSPADAHVAPASLGNGDGGDSSSFTAAGSTGTATRLAPTAPVPPPRASLPDWPRPSATAPTPSSPRRRRGPTKPPSRRPLPNQARLQSGL